MKFKIVSMLMLAGGASFATGPASASALDDIMNAACQLTPECTPSAQEQGGIGIVPDPTKLARWRGSDVERINTFKLHSGSAAEPEYALMIVRLNSVRSDSPTVACTQSAQEYESYSPIVNMAPQQ